MIKELTALISSLVKFPGLLEQEKVPPTVLGAPSRVFN
jgi:hypothetical protein